MGKIHGCAIYMMLVGVFFAMGCSGARATIEDRTLEDATCQVTKKPKVVEPISGLYYAKVCGETWRYVTGCNIFGYCVVHSSVNVDKILKKQASFDLQCDSIQSQNIIQLNRDTFGVKGCNKQISYTLRNCTRTNCEVVQNTQSQ